MLETLTCTAAAHEGSREWTRERKRGVKPRVCPVCRATETAAEATSSASENASAPEPVDQELVELYADERPGMPSNIIAAFIAADKEPPTIARWRRGFTAADMKVIGRYYSTHDPHGRKQQDAEIDAESD